VGDTCLLGKVNLSPAEAVAQGPEAATDLNVVHDSYLGGHRSPADHLLVAFALSTGCHRPRRVSAARRQSLTLGSGQSAAVTVDTAIQACR
jgi:hypothetical protein